MTSAFDYKTNKEELWNAISHGIGLILTIPAFVILILKGVKTGTTIHVVSYTIFGVSMLLLFLMSTLLHSMPIKFKKVFSILDHSAIYILIAGTYTPFLLISLRGALGWTLFGIIWGLAIFGIVFKVFFIHRYEFVSLIFYVAMGWLIIIAVRPLIQSITMSGFLFLLAGGLFYTVGAIFYAWRRLPYNHAIWHLFVIAGSACMYFSIYLYT